MTLTEFKDTLGLLSSAVQGEIKNGGGDRDVKVVVNEGRLEVVHKTVTTIELGGADGAVLLLVTIPTSGT